MNVYEQFAGMQVLCRAELEEANEGLLMERDIGGRNFFQVQYGFAMVLHRWQYLFTSSKKKNLNVVKYWNEVEYLNY